MSKSEGSPESNDEFDKKLLRNLRKHLWEGDWRKTIPDRQYTRAWFAQLELLEAKRTSKSTGKLVFRFPVQQEYLQQFQNLAGGAQAAFHDICTAWAMLTIAKPGFWLMTGRTTNLNVTYHKGAQLGEVLLLECEVVKAGARLATVRGTLKREKDGELVSTCEQNMYNTDTNSAKL